MVFLDIEKAFDTVWHDGLILKLNNSRFPMYIQKIIKHFLSDRLFVVCIDKSCSSPRKIPAGLPQGSVLSPTLYAIYASDIVMERYNEAAFYADVSAFVCSARELSAIFKRLKESLSCAEKYFLKWKIKINQEKTF